MIGHRLDDRRVLDAFAGSGLLGLEAWSRGARVVCIDNHPAAVRAIRTNVAALGADIDVVAADVLEVASRLGPFDIVLADPPYEEDPRPIAAALQQVAGHLLAVEVAGPRDAPDLGPAWTLRHKRYGTTALCVWRREVAPGQ